MVLSNWFLKWLCTLFLPLLLFTIPLLSCTGAGLLSPIITDVKDVMKDPAVQATVRNWMAETDVTNPRVSFLFGTIGELRFDGMIYRGSMQGGANHIPPDLLQWLVEQGYEPPIKDNTPKPPIDEEGLNEPDPYPIE